MGEVWKPTRNTRSGSARRSISGRWSPDLGPVPGLRFDPPHIEALRHGTGEPFRRCDQAPGSGGLLEGHVHFSWEIGGWQGLKGARTNTTVLAVLLDAVALGIARAAVGLVIIVGPRPRWMPGFDPSSGPAGGHGGGAGG
jgi:hypothetical protein